MKRNKQTKLVQQAKEFGLDPEAGASIGSLQRMIQKEKCRRKAEQALDACKKLGVPDSEIEDIINKDKLDAHQRSVPTYIVLRRTLKSYVKKHLVDEFKLDADQLAIVS